MARGLNRSSPYTGRLGSRDNNASASIRNGGNIVTAQTTAALARREGMSVAIWMPPGSVTRPTSSQEMAWYIRDNLAALISFASFLFIALYYYWAWNRVGRDPQGGPIVPRWDAPDDISPALVHYIHHKGLRGNDAFSAALLSLAVKGHVTLEELGKKDMKIQATGNIPKSGSLPVGEQVIYNKVSNRSGGFRIDKANGKSVVSLASGFRSKLASEHRNKYFVRNLPWIIAGVLMSAAAIAISLASAGGEADTIVPLVFGVIVASSLFMVVFNVLSRNAGFNGWSFAGIARWAVFGIVAFNFLPAVGGILASTGTNPLLLTAIGSIVVLNALFWYLLGAPTPLGQRLMDGIEGLKTYIKLAETDRLNLQGAPAMSPKHYRDRAALCRGAGAREALVQRVCGLACNRGRCCSCRQLQPALVSWRPLPCGQHRLRSWRRGRLDLELHDQRRTRSVLVIVRFFRRRWRWFRRWRRRRWRWRLVTLAIFPSRAYIHGHDRISTAPEPGCPARARMAQFAAHLADDRRLRHADGYHRLADLRRIGRCLGRAADRFRALAGQPRFTENGPEALQGPRPECRRSSAASRHHA
jgi:hypothetical protein